MSLPSTKFSVLMSIYYKEKPIYFDRAMQSIWDEQTLKPNEIVLVQDGKLTNDLCIIIEKWRGKLGEVLKIVSLEKNMGTGDAKKIGLQKCKFELVAVMDTDDIAKPDRFEKQIKVFQENDDIDVCSSWVSEFINDETNIISLRKIPSKHDDIIRFAKQRMPVNHPATMYRKKTAEKAGSYKKMMWFEDYYLMVRMALNNATFHNIQEPLVMMRAGYAQLERRSGLKYTKAEFIFQKELLDIGFLTKPQFIANVLMRLPIRISPKILIRKIYKLLRSSEI